MITLPKTHWLGICYVMLCLFGNSFAEEKSILMRMDWRGVYRLHVFSDGNVEFFDDNSGLSDKPFKTKKVSAHTIAQLTSEFRKIDFFSLRDFYNKSEKTRLPDGTEITVYGGSFPGVAIFFSEKGVSKTVAFNAGPPETLWKLADEIPTILGVTEWTNRSMSPNQYK